VIEQSNDSTAAIQAAKEFQGGGLGKGGGGGAKAEAMAGSYDPMLPPALGGGSGAGRGQGAQDDRQAAIMAGLMLGSPEFQRR